MSRLKHFICVGLLLCLVPGTTLAGSRWTLDMEAGAVLPGYNNIQIPNNAAGTRFSLKNDLNIHEKIYYRLRLSLRLGHRHELSLLYAPLSLKADGVLPGQVNFEGVSFPAGANVDALYRFNSYRLTYRYRLVQRPRLDLWLGFTAKIRDAEVKLESAAQQANNTNVGFVPLLHLYLDWKWHKKWGFLFEADALAAKQGRAEDVSAALYRRINDTLSFKLGYRIVEGGADVEEVYTFALINYIYAGLSFDFSLFL